MTILSTQQLLRPRLNPLARQIGLKRRRRGRCPTSTSPRPQPQHGHGNVELRDRSRMPGTPLECLQGILVNALVRAASHKHYPPIQSSLLRPSWWATHPSVVPIRHYSTQLGNSEPRGSIESPSAGAEKEETEQKLLHEWLDTKARQQNAEEILQSDAGEEAALKEVFPGVSVQVLDGELSGEGNAVQPEKLNITFGNGTFRKERTKKKKRISKAGSGQNGGDGKVINGKSDGANNQSPPPSTVCNHNNQTPSTSSQPRTSHPAPPISTISVEDQVDELLHNSSLDNSPKPTFTITHYPSGARAEERAALKEKIKLKEVQRLEKIAKARKDHIRGIRIRQTWQSSALRARMIRAEKMMALRRVTRRLQFSGRVSPKDFQQHLKNSRVGSGIYSPIGTAALLMSKMIDRPAEEENQTPHEKKIIETKRARKPKKDLKMARRKGLVGQYAGGRVNISAAKSRELRKFIRNDRAKERGRALGLEKKRVHVMPMEELKKMGAWSLPGKKTQQPRLDQEAGAEKDEPATQPIENLAKVLSQPVSRPRRSKKKENLVRNSNIDPSFLPWSKPENLDETERLLSFLEELQAPKQRDTLDDLFHLYRGLPEPRLSYLAFPDINLLLSHFISVPLRTDPLMVRYLSIIDDMRALRIPLTHAEWIVAISFVAQRFNSRIGIPEIEAALRLWAEAEDHAGIELGPTLYNILLDMASKGKQPELITAVLEEMQKRGIAFDRFTHTTMLTWYGSLQHADKVRQTFSEAVQTGEIVDTVVFNALLTALVRCKEFPVAEGIFGRMKASGRTYYDKLRERAKLEGVDLTTIPSPISPTTQPYTSRKLGKTLKYMALKHKQESPKPTPFPTEIAETIYSGPNIVTYNIFLHRYCKLGILDTVHALLAEMKEFNIRLEPSIFISLARGFALHGVGRHQGSKWTQERLEEVYEAMMRVITRKRHEGGAVRLSTVLACGMIKAFAVTTMRRGRTIEVYRDMEWLYERGFGHRREMDQVVLRVLQTAIGRSLGPEEGLRRGEGRLDGGVAIGGDGEKAENAEKEKVKQKQDEGIYSLGTLDT